METSRRCSASPAFLHREQEQKVAQQKQHFKGRQEKQLCQQVPDRLLSHGNLSQRAKQNLSLNSTPNTCNSWCSNICLAHSRLPTPHLHELPSHPGFSGSCTRTCFIQKLKRWPHRSLHPCFFQGNTRQLPRCVFYILQSKQKPQHHLKMLQIQLHHS